MFRNLENREVRLARRAPGTNSLPILIVTGMMLLSSGLLRAQAGSTNNQSPVTATVPAGTRLIVKMIDSVDSDKSNPNDRFRGSLEANLMAGNIVVAPKGTTVFGRVLTAESAGRSGGQLEFDLTDIMLNGQTFSLATSSNQIQGQGATGGQSATGAKAGAAVGAVTGGISGAIRGAGAGAVAGHVAGASTSGERVNVPAGTQVEFTLDHPVSLPVAK
jgi:hypothetical protein